MNTSPESSSFDAEQYWNRRLENEFSLRGVGHVQFSRAYNSWLYARKADVLRAALQAWVGGLSGTEVLDIGSGTGFFMERYLAAGARVMGVDISRRSVDELAARFPAADVRLLDISDVDGVVPGRTFDIINMWDVMYHIVSEDRFASACRNIAAMSRPGTCFLVTDLMASPNGARPAPHVAFRNRAAYADALSPYGFVHVGTRPLYRFLNRHYPWPKLLTDLLAPFWYGFDSLNRTIDPGNLCLSVWKRKG